MKTLIANIQNICNLKPLKTFTVALFVLIPCLVNAKTIVITDIDDTLRITNRIKGGYIEQAENVLSPYTHFSGMNDIINTLYKNGADIYYVTAANSWIVDLSIYFLDFNQYPQTQNIFYREGLEDVQNFKTRTISEIINHTLPDTIVYLGDNGEFDSPVYEQFNDMSRKNFISIRKLYEYNGVVVPETQRIFITAADLAAQLEQAELLSSQQAQAIIAKISSEIMSQDDYQFSLILPDWTELTDRDFQRAYSVPMASEETQIQLNKLREDILLNYQTL
jgi:phosphatidate phosphatase APP1